MNVILITTITLGGLGLMLAVIIYFVSQKFKVIEDPRIDQVEGLLPAANCGGCGQPGCRAFAEALVKADDISNLICPVSGKDEMAKIAEILGKQAAVSEPKVAVVRCNGSCENRPKVNQYQGSATCAIESALYGGETNCTFGCSGLGDCVTACKFDAVFIDKTTGLPVVIEEKCVACGACIKVCPKKLIELRKVGPKSRRIYVSCMNKDKGAIAGKACVVACIGCAKCQKECKFDAIIVENNLAYIDDNKCRICRKCVEVCPKNSIIELNFPPRKNKVEEIVSSE